MLTCFGCDTLLVPGQQEYCLLCTALLRDYALGPGGALRLAVIVGAKTDFPGCQYGHDQLQLVRSFYTPMSAQAELDWLLAELHVETFSLGSELP